MSGLKEEKEKPREKSKELSLTQNWLAAAWRSNGASPFDAAAVAKRAASKARRTSAIRNSGGCQQLAAVSLFVVLFVHLWVGIL